MGKQTPGPCSVSSARVKERTRKYQTLNASERGIPSWKWGNRHRIIGCRSELLGKMAFVKRKQQGGEEEEQHTKNNFERIIFFK